MILFKYDNQVTRHAVPTAPPNNILYLFWFPLTSSGFSIHHSLGSHGYKSHKTYIPTVGLVEYTYVIAVVKPNEMH